MATVSTTLPSDGQTIDAADVNTPINAILSEFNGNIDNDNIKSGAAISGSKIADASITNAKLSTTAGELGGAWQDWTPTYTNLTLGNGTVTAKYKQIGKTVIARYKLVFGSTTSISSSVTISVPVTAASFYSTGKNPVGTAFFEDDSGTDILGQVVFEDSTTHVTPTPQYVSATPTYVAWSRMSTAVPFTWTTNDMFTWNIIYEAA